MTEIKSNTWYKCTDVLPPLGDYHLLVCYADEDVGMVHVENYFTPPLNGYIPDYVQHHITHWVQLPKLPNGDIA